MVAIAVGSMVADSPRGITQTLPLVENLTAYDTPQGEQYFIESDARDDFWELSAQFLTQITQSYCGVASAVMVLNSLKLPPPHRSPLSALWRFYPGKFLSKSKNRKSVTCPSRIASGNDLAAIRGTFGQSWSGG